MNNFFIFISYYILILTSIVGYGIFFVKLLKLKLDFINFGYAGLFGIYILIVYSYFSNLFIAHNESHNLVILFIGLILFIYSIKQKYSLYKNEIFFSLIVFSLLFCAVLQFKNHDDFPYYHFPYTYYLTQQSLHIGIGQFNHGFRTPSSIFYINSLFYLPYAKFYLLNFFSLFILGFANIVLLKKVHNYFKFVFTKDKQLNFIHFLSLLSFVFINIFFYRISEYGTDRAAMILVFLFIIELLNFINLKTVKTYNLFYIYLLGALIISFKAFYILYIIFIIPLFLYILRNKKNYIQTSYFLFFNRYFILVLVLIFFIIFTYFINTGCLVYPLSLTCFDGISWGIPLIQVQQMNDWYELWSKGGAAPNFRIENPEEYIKNFNWISNWIDIYFFNKVSDFILGIILLISIFLFFFKKSFFKKTRIKVDHHVYLVYLLILILGIEWFYNHPALRYGGYHIIALVLFIPISVKLGSAQIDLKKYSKISIVLVSLTTIIFLSRNINRIVNEVEQYSYKPIRQTYYFLDDSHFRIQKEMDQSIEQYNNCKNKDFECNKDVKIKKVMGKIIFINQ
jgi:hypothetical protein